jgi:pimeloyl-ACP methyl ester carboxylesterase
VPVLAISGELDGEDHLRLGRRLAAEVPDGRWAGIDGAAHYPSMERPDAFTGLLREFLAEHVVAAAQQ